MKGNELYLWVASLTLKRSATLSQYRLTVECWSLTNIAQFLQPLLSAHALLSGYLGRSQRYPLNRGFTVLNWRISGYFSLHFRWVIHRPVEIAIGNGSEKSYMYFYPFILFFQKTYLTLASHQCGPGSNLGVDAINYVGWVCCWCSPLLREVFLRVLRFSASPLKPTLANSNSIWNAQTCSSEFLTTPRCSAGQQITPKKNGPSCWKR